MELNFTNGEHIDFAWQQWLRERAAMSHYKYHACLIYILLRADLTEGLIPKFCLYFMFL